MKSELSKAISESVINNTRSFMENNEFSKNWHFYLISCLIIISFYSFGNFGFWNIFGIKFEVNIFLVLFLIPISIFLFFLNWRNILSNPWVVLIFYLLISSLLMDTSNYTQSIKLLFALSLVTILLSMDFKYINFIIKSIIIISFLFSIIGILLFIYYQLNPDLLIGLDRVFRSYDTYTDLTHIPLHQKFGFVIETAEKNIFGLEYIRSRSYVSEPSATVHIFFASAILSLLYSKNIKKMGIVIFFFGIVLIYSGSVILSLVFSIFYAIGKAFINLGEKRESIIIIIIAIISAYLMIYFIDISMLQVITPESKSTSLSSRLLPIVDYLDKILDNIFHKKDLEIGSFVGILLIFSGVVPILGMLLTGYMIYVFLNMSIKVYEQQKLFSILIVGLLIQISLFSSGGWVTIGGLLMLTLIYIKLQNEVKDIE